MGRKSLAPAAVLVLAVVLGWSWIKPAGQAAILIGDVFGEPLVGANLAAPVTPEPRISETSGASAGTTMRVTTWRPGWGDRHPAILLVPGAAREGNDDKVVRRFGASLARAGYLVMLPELPFLKEGRFERNGLEQIDAAFAGARALPETQGRNVGAFGISVGGGLMLAAAGTGEALRGAAFLAVLGAYYDIDTYLASVASSTQRLGGNDVSWEPAAEARERLPLAVLNLAPAEERDALRRALAPAPYDEALQRIRSLPAATRAAFDAVSPETVWRDIVSPIYWNPRPVRHVRAARGSRDRGGGGGPRPSNGARGAAAGAARLSRGRGGQGAGSAVRRRRALASARLHVRDPAARGLASRRARCAEPDDLVPLTAHVTPTVRGGLRRRSDRPRARGGPDETEPADRSEGSEPRGWWTIGLMAERLPLFPLSLVLFPGVLLPLHIFEHRYRLLVARAVERSEPFGVVLIKSGQEVGAPADPHSVGTSARIVTFDPQPDGRSLLIARGERRFAIERVIADEEPYLVGSVRWLDETEGDGLLAAAQAAAGAYREYLTAAGALLEASGQPRPEPLAAGTAPADLAYRIASDLPIPDEDRQRLLEQETAADRLMHELPLLARETELLRTVLAGLRAPGPGDRPN